MNTPAESVLQGAAAYNEETATPPRVWSDEQLVPDLHAESYRVHEVAHLLGIHHDVIRHAIQQGELRAVQVGHDVHCISRADLLAWLSARGPGV
jgi:excisionase family DNA binding protein